MARSNSSRRKSPRNHSNNSQAGGEESPSLIQNLEEHFEEVDTNAAAAVAESRSASIRQGAQALVNSRRAAFVVTQASPMSSQSPTPRKANIRSQRPNKRTCPKYFTDKWLELYKKCYGCDESITQVPDPPSAFPQGNFNRNFPAFAQAYDRLYNPNNPVFSAHYITDPDQIRCVLPLYVAASINGEYIFGLELAEAFGISEEAHQMVALDLEQNPMQAQINLPVREGGEEEGNLPLVFNMNPEAILVSGIRFPHCHEYVYMGQSDEVKRELSVLDSFMRKHRYQNIEGARSDMISFAEDMPMFYYNYFRILTGSDSCGNPGDPDDGDPGGNSEGDESDSDDDNEDDDDSSSNNESEEQQKKKSSKGSKKPSILEGLDAVLVSDKKLSFELGAELAIKSLTLINDVFTSTILVPLNHAMHMKSKVVRELGAEIESYQKSKSKCDSEKLEQSYIRGCVTLGEVRILRQHMIKRRDEHRKLMQEAKEDRLQFDQMMKLIGEGKWTDFGDFRSSAYSRYVEALNEPTFTLQRSHPIIKQLIERLGPNGFPIKVRKKSKKKEGGVKDDREYYAFEQHQRQLKSKSGSEKKTAPKDTAKTKKTAPKDTAKPAPPPPPLNSNDSSIQAPPPKNATDDFISPTTKSFAHAVHQFEEKSRGIKFDDVPYKLMVKKISGDDPTLTLGEQNPVSLFYLLLIP
eukprot:scaffold90387_cov25-Cyclotella_meneghiniana.AAC.2